MGIIKNLRARLHTFSPSLKKRIISLFLLSCILNCAGFVTLSGYTIYNLIDKKIAASYENNLSQIKVSMEIIITNMNLVTQQLTYGNDIYTNLYEYMTAADTVKEASLYRILKNNILNTTFSNTDIGLLYYYNASEDIILLNNLPVSEGTTPMSDTRVLMSKNDMIYFTPHTSHTRFNGNPVISLRRKVSLVDGEELYIYVESGYYSIKNIIAACDAFGSYLVLLDPESQIVYSNVPGEDYKTGIFMDSGEALSGQQKDYYWFKAISSSGWSIISVTPSSVYKKEAVQWTYHIAFIAALFFLLSGVMGLIAWHMVYRPLKIFDLQINNLLRKESEPAGQSFVSTNIPEYDYLLGHIQDMKLQINEMIEKIITQEKQYAKTEIEKLRYQINPHFLMNTLNTVHWMAFMNKQDDIDHIVQSLNRLLAYNLDKTGEHTTIARELTAVSDYVDLQRVRYHFEYTAAILSSDSMLDYPCPKFVLQPLVENALHHGYVENMSLSIQVKISDKIKISITDTGTGMPPGKVRDLEYLYRHENLHDDTLDFSRDKYLGIGLKYVFQSLEDFYKSQFEFYIESKENQGTTFTIILPKLKGGGYRDENIDC